MKTGPFAVTARRENIAKRRQSPEVGAVCLNWARTDLCGGREVTRVPTAPSYCELLQAYIGKYSTHVSVTTTSCAGYQ